MQSGSALASWGLSHYPIFYAHQLLNRFNCTGISNNNNNNSNKNNDSPDVSNDNNINPKAVKIVADSISSNSDNNDDVRSDERSDSHITVNKIDKKPPPGSTLKSNARQDILNSPTNLQCLKTVGISDLMSFAPKPPKYLTAFGPHIDQHSVVLAEDRTMFDSVSSTNLLIGVSKNEGWAFMDEKILQEGLSPDLMTKMLKSQSKPQYGYVGFISHFLGSIAMRTYVQNVHDYNRQGIYDVIAHQYNEWDDAQLQMQHDPEFRSKPSLVLRNQMADFLGDGQVVAPVIETALHHVKHGAPTYLYVFEPPSSASLSFSSSTSSSSSKSKHQKHQQHHYQQQQHEQQQQQQRFSTDDDLAFIFGAPLVSGLSPFDSKDDHYKLEDGQLALQMIKIWAQFARTGNPNIYNSSSSTQRGSQKSSSPSSSSSSSSYELWPKFNIHTQTYVQFGNIEIKVIQRTNTLKLDRERRLTHPDENGKNRLPAKTGT
ncbi:hypothetical protein HELRODRAFT_170957 [Helobdella robusta]|uniref:Carboxylesterase type B domain-containing protein n=1 Tax=Helobdella robusta TaxID=6412 RepID=T1F3M4_HELRO|nr:hypothetical protein HELRODRAFT_170957 [Helobdella robusta]ESO06923.1 hypothetical protein HELRODRAFT_170957 [Helobdella robusta]